MAAIAGVSKPVIASPPRFIRTLLRSVIHIIRLKSHPVGKLIVDRLAVDHDRLLSRSV